MPGRDDNLPIVSDHAVVRYLQRVMGMDIEAIKEEILCGNDRVTVGKLGNGKYPIGNGHRAVVSNMTVVTVI